MQADTDLVLAGRRIAGEKVAVAPWPVAREKMAARGRARRRVRGQGRARSRRGWKLVAAQTDGDAALHEA